MSKRLVAAAMLAALLSGCSTVQTVVGGTAGSEDTAGYIARAASEDLFAMQASQLALAQAQNPEVRQLARWMIKDHSMATQELAAAALEAHLDPLQPGLTGGQQQMLDALRNASAGSFDSLYLRQQLPFQQAAMRFHQGYALSGNVEPVRFAASTASGMAIQHYQDVRRVRRETGL